MESLPFQKGRYFGKYGNFHFLYRIIFGNCWVHVGKLAVSVNPSHRNMKLSEYAKNTSNPFMEKALEVVQPSIKFRSATGTSRNAVLVAIDPETGEQKGHTTFMRQIEVDEEKFAKIYLSQFVSFFELSNAAIRIFGYIMQQMQPGSDRIEFILQDCLEYAKYQTSKPVYAGLAELLKHEIIARGYKDNIYFINPMIVFNGNRITYVQSYVKKKALAKRDPNQIDIFEPIS